LPIRPIRHDICGELALIAVILKRRAGALKMTKRTKDDDVNETRLSQLLTELAAKISNSLGESGERATGVPGLMLYRCTAPTVPSPCTYDPSLLVIAQGRKRVNLGNTSYVFGQSRFLLTSLELPVVSQVITASEEAPYLAFFLKLDISTVRDILNTEEVPVPEATSGTRGMAIGVTTAELVNSCCRMMDLLDAPQDIPFFGKLIQREIIYRLLQGSQGARLRAIATFGDQSNRTAKVVAWLSSNYEKPLRVDQLATIAGMSRSTLQHHFRALTAMSPLQFQKRLRLHAARQRMLTGELDAASAAFEVGYESPSQFNREYRRFFGQPPMRDIKGLRDSKVVGIPGA
jgi:AraC-like DNA-binding protein